MSIAAAGSENCLAIGTRLSDFELTGVLGEGGFGIVYLAFDHALQRTVGADLGDSDLLHLSVGQ